ncbi:MAG TPA: nucleotidyltransferase domain-containing protein [Thermoplasmata archaeon]
MIPAALLKTLASKGRVDLIRTLRSFPGRDFTINELARTSKVPTMTTWRAVRDLRKAGLVATKRVGNAVVVSLTEDRDQLRILRIVPETDPQRTAAILYAGMVGDQPWIEECRLFGSIGRGEHAPGEEVDVAVVFSDGEASEHDVRTFARSIADRVKAETNVDIVPLCIPRSEMSRKGGLGWEMRDKEVIWRRKQQVRK